MTVTFVYYTGTITITELLSPYPSSMTDEAVAFFSQPFITALLFLILAVALVSGFGRLIRSLVG